MIIPSDKAPEVIERLSVESVRLTAADWSSMLPIIQNDKRLMFVTETAADGQKWAPLAPVTVEKKGFNTVLIDTGRLWESLTTPGGNADTILEIQDSPIGLVFGTKVPYARYHQTGTKRMPARPITGLSDRATQELVDGLTEAVVRRMTEG